MARPTNKERVLKLLRNTGALYVAAVEDDDCELDSSDAGWRFRAIRLDVIRQSMGPGFDTVILDLLSEDTAEHHTFLRDIHHDKHGAQVGPPGIDHEYPFGHDSLHLCVQVVEDEDYAADATPAYFVKIF